MTFTIFLGIWLYGLIALTIALVVQTLRRFSFEVFYPNDLTLLRIDDGGSLLERIREWKYRIDDRLNNSGLIPLLFGVAAVILVIRVLMGWLY